MTSHRSRHEFCLGISFRIFIPEEQVLHGLGCLDPATWQEAHVDTLGDARSRRNAVGR